MRYIPISIGRTTELFKVHFTTYSKSCLTKAKNVMVKTH